MGFLNREEKQHRRSLQRAFAINVLLVLLIISSLILAFVFLVKVEKNDELAAQEKAEKESALADELIKAQESQDDEAADELYQQLKESDPSAKSLRHLLFVHAVQRNESEYAEQLQQELAPDTGAIGYPLTHYVVALGISQKKGMQESDFILMNRHLTAAVGGEGVPDDAYRLLGDGQFAMRQHKEAIDSYRKIESPTADTQYKIGLAFLQTRNDLQAMDELTKAAEMYSDKYKKNKEDTKSLILWTKALFLTGRANEAEKLLLTHLEENDNVVVRNELIQSYLAQLMGTSNLIRRKEMLKRICELDPSMRIHPKTREAFFTLANYLVREQRYAEAKAYYHVCANRIKFPPSVKNNLAWVETRIEDGDLQMALQLSNEAIEDSQENAKPEFYGTRGQIKARLGQWESALEDLEKALPSVQSKHEVQLALSVVYSRIGENDKATRMFAQAKVKETASLEELLTLYPN